MKAISERRQMLAMATEMKRARARAAMKRATAMKREFYEGLFKKKKKE